MQSLIFIDRMWSRIEAGRCDSDATLFTYLMYGAEFFGKLVIASLVSALHEERERYRYSQLHRLVRADGIGEWASVIDEILLGPASQYFPEALQIEQRELVQKHTVGAWQHDCVADMHRCVSLVESAIEELPVKVEAKRWFSLLARLRNKTRGHGAQQPEVLSKICPFLETSMHKFVDNFALFKKEWAYLHRNLSGKYRVTKLSPQALAFEQLKKSNAEGLSDGVAFFANKIIHVELLFSDVDAGDFFVANGGFTEKRHEVISYITGNTKSCESTLYIRPSGSLPDSETHALGELDVQGHCFSNLPSLSNEYIKRTQLERELTDAIMDDRHPIVSLTGRGGIGKTSLALAVLNREICNTERFDVVIWFSARDIDLLPTGPKPVKPHILTIKDVAREFARLISPPNAREKGFRPEDYFAAQLSHSQIGKTLFVFDNFETVSDPIEFYSWLDANIRNPNKCLITTRNRYFRGDYPIEVRGMTDGECEQLITSMSGRLGIRQILTSDYCQRIIHESDGHPYVIKILLGEVAKSKTLRDIERIVADKENILTALFERTYGNLSPVAQRVFLTLCGWRSTVPQLALEAVLLHARNERMDIPDAVEELHRSSFVDIIDSSVDTERFINVPLVASAFGKPKFRVSPSRSAIEADIHVLRQFGASQPADARHGIAPRIEKLIQHLSIEISQERTTISEQMPMLEFIARRYSAAWFHIARLWMEEGNETDALPQAANAISRYLESQISAGSDSWKAWKLLAHICYKLDDIGRECHALAMMSECVETPLIDISNAAARFSHFFYHNKALFERQEKKIIVSRLAKALDNRIAEGDATDRSRLAWLYLHLQNEPMARQQVLAGLGLDPDNEYCIKLAERLHIHRGSRSSSSHRAISLDD